MSSHASASSDRVRNIAHGLNLDVAESNKSQDSSGSLSNKDSPTMSGNGRQSSIQQKQSIAPERKKSLYEAETDKCPVCMKSVFTVERVIAAGLKWHQSCFGKVFVPRNVLKTCSVMTVIERFVKFQFCNRNCHDNIRTLCRALMRFLMSTLLNYR